MTYGGVAEPREHANGAQKALLMRPCRQRTVATGSSGWQVGSARFRGAGGATFRWEGEIGDRWDAAILGILPQYEVK